MKDGTLAASGSMDDIIKADPETYEEIKQVTEAGWDEKQAESAEEERTVLKRNVSIASAGLLALSVVFSLVTFCVSVC